MIDIDSLTLGEIKQIAALTVAPVATQPLGDYAHLVGKDVTIRHHLSGVWMGRLNRETANVLAITGRRIYYWKAMDVSALAVDGPKPESKATVETTVVLERSNLVEVHASTPAAVGRLASLPVSA
jgi:hypothetical protein